MVIPWQVEVIFALAAGQTTRLLGSPELTYGFHAVSRFNDAQTAKAVAVSRFQKKP
jgi:hypothetical protein